jgi:hypothetical protein
VIAAPRVHEPREAARWVNTADACPAPLQAEAAAWPEVGGRIRTTMAAAKPSAASAARRRDD